ncbi:hypothetical protein C7M84_010340 [Penaeus vannamei]|uniref:Uncharacterized protein n=1 Tax=Penaeus vannamei TaxID=6689 RepID=A0A423T557_PENVA|nr:hypothetical protein C7M84_010340 [Penaeus vannamei]
MTSSPILPQLKGMPFEIPLKPALTPLVDLASRPGESGNPCFQRPRNGTNTAQSSLTGHLILTGITSLYPQGYQEWKERGVASVSEGREEKRRRTWMRLAVACVSPCGTAGCSKTTLPTLPTPSPDHPAHPPLPPHQTTLPTLPYPLVSPSPPPPPHATRSPYSSPLPPSPDPSESPPPRRSPFPRTAGGKAFPSRERRVWGSVSLTSNGETCTPRGDPSTNHRSRRMTSSPILPQLKGMPFEIPLKPALTPLRCLHPHTRPPSRSPSLPSRHHSLVPVGRKIPVYLALKSPGASEARARRPSNTRSEGTYHPRVYRRKAESLASRQRPGESGHLILTGITSLYPQGYQEWKERGVASVSEGREEKRRRTWMRLAVACVSPCGTAGCSKVRPASGRPQTHAANLTKPHSLTLRKYLAAPTELLRLRPDHQQRAKVFAINLKV